MYAQVIVDVASQSVAKPYTYTVPDGMALKEGMLVSVPFGPRKVSGYVVSLTEEAPADVPPGKLRPVARALDSEPAVLPALMALARELSAQAHCPLCETLRLMLPPGMRDEKVRKKTELFAALTPEASDEAVAKLGRRAPKQAAVLRLLQGGAPKSLGELSALVSNPRDALRALEKSGLVTLRSARCSARRTARRASRPRTPRP